MELLKDKVAVVTGGTRGIGLAIVKKFLENGATVVLCGSRQESADKAVAELKQENSGYKVSGIAPKLSDSGAMRDSLTKIADMYGKVNILVNNAGISAREGIEEYKDEDFEKILELNVKAVFAGTKAVVPLMKKNGGGVILNTSSMVSIYGQPSGCGYPASKFAVNGLTKSLARELGKDNIRVNAVAPGVIRTDMVAALPEETVAKISAGIPLGRMGEPEDVANAFLFLASDLASYVTGAVLSVDGATQV